MLARATAAHLISSALPLTLTASRTRAREGLYLWTIMVFLIVRIEGIAIEGKRGARTGGVRLSVYVCLLFSCTGLL